MSRRDKIAAVLTVHREGVMAGLSLRSFIDATEYANDNGLEVKNYIYMDRPDLATREFMMSLEANNIEVKETDYGDQGLVRNQAVDDIKENYVAFLDGDDLWSYNWIVEAYKRSKELRNVIVHPEFNWFFDGSDGLIMQPDQSEETAPLEFLRTGNLWDALSFCARGIHKNFPYANRDMEAGFAYEDWHWNCETILAGYRHVTAKDTIHFKRRRIGSQTIQASQGKALIPPTEFCTYKYAVGD